MKSSGRPVQRSRAAALIGLLTAAMAATIFCRAALSILAPLLLRDLDLTRGQIGVGVAAFSGTAACFSLLAGRITDRIPLRLTMTLSFAAPAVAMGLLGRATSFAAVLVAAVVAGTAGALGNPATNKAVAAMVPPSGRGTAVGAKQSGVQVGLLLAGIYLPLAERLFGWRSGLLVVAGLFVAAAVTCLVLFDRLGMSGAPDRQSPSAAPPPAAVAYRHPPEIRSMAWYALFMGLGGNALFAYLPLYAHERAGLTVEQAGMVATVVGAVAIVARIMTARASDTLAKVSAWMFAMAVAALAFALLLALQGEAAWLIWVIAAGLGASTEAWNSVVMMGILLVVPPGVVGRASGLILMMFLIGSALGPALFGLMVDSTGSYSYGFLAVSILFAVNLRIAASWRRRQHPGQPSEPGQ